MSLLRFSSVFALTMLALPACSAGTSEGAEDQASAVQTRAASIWSSPEACDAALALKARETHAPGAARMATWNLRWFPDGVMPSSGDAPKPTNLHWMACAMAWMDVDLISVQEVLKHPVAEEAMQKLVAEVSELTGGDWRSEIDPCPHPDAQHQGYIYDARKVSLERVHTFNWREGDDCNLSRRPGLEAYARFGTGFDAHLVAVHQKSGVDKWSHDLRAEALSRLPALYSDAQSSVADPDVIVAGDFNTMGCTYQCGGISPADEVSSFDAAAKSAGFSRIESDQTCSEYSGASYRKLLDHFVVSESVRTAVPRKARLSGYCADVRCEALSGVQRAQNELSDHCPMLLDIGGED